MLESHMKTFMASLHKMKENDVMTDITLKLPDESAVSCHKIVLMASSPFFEAMFQSGLKETNEQDIQLDFADADIIRMLVEFFYSGEIDVNEDNVQTLVATSEFLCMKDLKDHCDKFMAALIDSSNCIELSKFGKKFNLMTLTSTAQDFILLNFKDVVNTFSKFKTLTEEELVEVVSSDELNAENEDIVFRAVVRWVNVDADERKEAFSRIAPLIRFPFCTQETLINVVGREPLMWNPRCMDLIQEAHNYNMNYQHSFYNTRTVPRLAFSGKKQHLVQLYAPSFSTIQCQFAECTEGDSVRWKTIVKDDKKIANIMVSPSEFIWACNDRCFTLVIPNGKVCEVPWKRNENPRYCKYFFFNGRIFAFGCRTSVESFRLNESDPKWKSEAPMLHALERPSVVQFTNMLYVIGGHDANGSSTVTQEFDPVLSEWKLRSPMPGVCESGAAVALNDKIFVVGGKERACFNYEPATDIWTVLSQTEHAYDQCSATTWNGRILLMGKEHAEEYDIQRDCWLPKDSLVPNNVNASRPDCFILSTFLI